MYIDGLFLRYLALVCVKESMFTTYKLRRVEVK